MLTDNISKEVLENYVKTREKIDKEVNQLLVFTSLLRQYQDCAGDEVLVDMHAIGYVNTMLHNQLHQITDELDTFLPLWEVIAELDAKEPN